MKEEKIQKHKLANDKLKKRIKNNFTIIQLFDTLEENNFFQDKLFQIYGIKNQVQGWNYLMN